MKNVILSIALVLSLPNTPVLNEDYFELLPINYVSTQFLTMGAPTDKGYRVVYEGFGAHDGSDLHNNNNIIRIPYEFNIDTERLAQASYSTNGYVWDFVPIFSTDYHYLYFTLVPNSNKSIPSPYDANPFYLAQFDEYNYWVLTIPTNHTTPQSIPVDDIKGGNNKWYSYELSPYFYDLGYTEGYDMGFDDGYNQGLDYAYTNPPDDVFNPVFTMLSNGFNSLAKILAIPLFPGFSLGTLLFLPVIVGVGYGLIKLLMGSGK